MRGENYEGGGKTMRGGNYEGGTMRGEGKL